MFRSSHQLFASALLLSISICLGTMATTEAAAVDESDAETDVVVIRGKTGLAQRFNVEQLRKLPRTEVEATDRNGQRVQYVGVTLSELLGKVGTAQGDALRGDWLRAFVAVDARDKYRAIFALPEFDSAYTDRVIILAYEREGQPLDLKAGPLQIIVPGEKKHARWVRMVKEIRVFESPTVTD
jgi:hypothetical protein